MMQQRACVLRVLSVVALISVNEMASKWQLLNALASDNTTSHSELAFYVLRLENHPIQIGYLFEIPNENAPFTPHFIFIRCSLFFSSIALSSEQFIFFLRLLLQ